MGVNIISIFNPHDDNEQQLTDNIQIVEDSNLVDLSGGSTPVSDICVKKDKQR